MNHPVSNKEMQQLLQQQLGEEWDGEYYTEEDYAELQHNLILYKTGNAEATTYIVKVFHPFITKYVRFIINGEVPRAKYIDKNGNENSKISPTISKFINLFIDKKQLQELQRKEVFSNTCTRIKALFRKYEYGDIYNELVLALLNMANKYKITHEGDEYHKKNGTFHMYIGKCFHWEAYRFLSKLIKPDEPLHHLDMMCLADDRINNEHEDEICDSEVVIEDEKAGMKLREMLENTDRELSIQQADTLTLKEKKELNAYDLDSLNFNWTNGVTCSELFKILTPYEREIIILSFIKNKTDIEIGLIYGCHRATINEHKKKAVKKIQQYAAELKILKEE